MYLISAESVCLKSSFAELHGTSPRGEALSPSRAVQVNRVGGRVPASYGESGVRKSPVWLSVYKQVIQYSYSEAVAWTGVEAAGCVGVYREASLLMQRRRGPASVRFLIHAASGFAPGTQVAHETGACSSRSRVLLH